MGATPCIRSPAKTEGGLFCGGWGMGGQMSPISSSLRFDKNRHEAKLSRFLDIQLQNNM